MEGGIRRGVVVFIEEKNVPALIISPFPGLTSVEILFIHSVKETVA